MHGGGTAPPSLQAVKGASEITVDGNGDNSVDTNDFHFENGLNCISVNATTISTQATNADVGDPIHDSATIGGTGLTTGNIHFELFGPYPTGTVPTSSTCTLAKRVYQHDTATNGTAGNPYGSGNYNTTAAGLYFWTAHYKDDSALLLEADSPCGASADETSTVAKKSPGMTTESSPHTVTLAAGLTISDTASITGAYPTPGGIGSISFQLYRGTTATACTTLVATVGIAGGLSAANGSNTSATVPITQPGFYNWVAIYTGDANNNGKTHPATCGTDANERVRVVNPGIMIEKTVNLTRVRPGTEVTYTIKVTNTGDDALTNVTVTDNKFPLSCNKNIGNLAAHADTTYTCKVTLADADANASKDVVNLATVTGTEPDSGNTVTDDDDATVHLIHPSILIVKTACRTAGTLQFPLTGGPVCAPDGTLLTVHVGDQVTYHIKVTNTGDDTLTNVTVNDPTRPGCNSTIASLAPLGVFEYDCTPITIGAGDDNLENTATATGTDSGTTPATVTDDDKANVDTIHPSIQVTKTACRTGGTLAFPFTGETCAPDGETLTVHAGDQIVYHFLVENTGDVDLSGVTLADDKFPACNTTIGTLAAHASTEVTCLVTIGTDDVTNTATASGTDTIGGSVSDTDTAVTDVIHPSIMITKTACLDRRHARLPVHRGDLRGRRCHADGPRGRPGHLPLPGREHRRRHPEQRHSGRQHVLGRLQHADRDTRGAHQHRENVLDPHRYR